MSDETYNGWTNRSTWLVPLWIDNEYQTYQRKMNLLAGHERITATIARRIAKEELGATFLIRQDGGKIGEVNWTEIAEHWETERQEQEQYNE